MAEQLRVLLVVHRAGSERGYTAPYFDALKAQFDPHAVYVEDGWPASWSEIGRGEQYDACLWFVRFRELAARPAFDWGTYAGLRVMQEHDAYLSYGSMNGPSPYLGAWPEVVRRHRFDLLVASGKDVTERLRSDGVPAVWVAKGYDAHRFHDLGHARSGIATYGSPYASRRLALAALRRGHVAVDRFTCAFEDLNATLNHYSAGIVCNLFAAWRPPFAARGPLGRLITRVAPRTAFGLRAGIEPMIKNFEVAGAGCAPIADWIPELADLGFEDGSTVVAYRDLDELVDRARHYASRPDELASIGRRAAELCRARHTWSHRTRELETVLRAHLGVNRTDQ